MDCFRELEIILFILSLSGFSHDDTFGAFNDIVQIISIVCIYIYIYIYVLNLWSFGSLLAV